MIHCLHGFLGRGDDFAPFTAPLEQTGFGPVRAPDLLSSPPRGLSLTAWGAQFARTAGGDPDSAVLVGYSLGGRLALHALLAAPTAWRAAVVLAAHPGLVDPREREARLRDDDAWARRFEAESWSTLLDAWNGRAVFGRRPAPPRAEADFDRAALAAALRDWSLGAQADLRPVLASIPCPVLWLVGADDYKFRALAADAVPHLPHGEVVVVPGAAHRVHVDAPQRFIEETTDFLRRVRGD